MEHEKAYEMHAQAITFETERLREANVTLMEENEHFRINPSSEMLDESEPQASWKSTDVVPG